MQIQKCSHKVIIIGPGLKLEQAGYSGDPRLVRPVLGRHCDVLEVSLPSHLNLSATFSTFCQWYTNRCHFDTAAMDTLIRDDYHQPIHDPNQIGQVCIMAGIGADPVQCWIVYNVPITVGAHTFLHTVCFAPVNDACLLGLDFYGLHPVFWIWERTNLQ